jgi:hypothetical protein
MGQMLTIPRIQQYVGLRNVVHMFLGFLRLVWSCLHRPMNRGEALEFCCAATRSKLNVALTK